MRASPAPTGGRRQALRRWLPGARSGPPAALPGGAPALPEGARILLLRPDHLGDLLFLGPALAWLEGQRPDLRPCLLVGPWSRAVAERLPGGARVETLNYPWFDRQPKGRPWRPYLRLLRAASRLRGRFDAALVLRDDDGWSAWLCALAGIPLRAGHAHPDVDPFVTHQLPRAARPRHVAAANLALVSSLLATEPGPFGPAAHPLGFRLEPEDHRRAEALLAGLDQGPETGPGAGPQADAASIPLAVHPGSGSEIKRWRTGAWLQTIEALTAVDQPVVLTGGPDETSLTARLAAMLDRRVLDLAGRTDLATLAAIYARCQVVMGPDSGPLHLAVAMGRPSLHLYGPADAERFGPWGDARRHRVLRSRLPCAPCGRLDWSRPIEHPCLRSIEVAEMVAAGRSLLDASGGDAGFDFGHGER